MNLNKVLSIIFLSSILYFIYFLITHPSKEHQQNANILFQEIVNKDVDKLSIVISQHSDYSYLLINDKKIINQFMDALKSDTYIPKRSTGQYNNRYVITLHSKERSNLLVLRSDTFNRSIKNDSVEITLFDVRNIDVLNLYYKSQVTGKNFFSILDECCGYGKYDLRNHELYIVLNKYIKGKGLKYNPTSKKWTKN